MTVSWPQGANPWKINATRVVHCNSFFAVEENAVTRPDGSVGGYEVVRFQALSVGILPIDEDGFVHMIGQWRLPLGRYSWEMPEGGLEPGEDALSCAKRELNEETGLSASHWQELLRLDLSTSLTDEQAVIFIATGLKRGAPHPDNTEELSHRRVHFTELLAGVLDGSVREAMTVAGVLCAQHFAATQQLSTPLCASMLARVKSA